MRSADEAHDPQRAPELDRLRLALELVNAGAFVGDGALGGSFRRGADEHGAGLGDRLDSARRVDEIARDHTLSLGAQRHRRLAGEHADPGAEIRRAEIRPEHRHRVDELECCADGAVGVVLLRDRCSPDGHHRVADELLDRAAIALDHLPGGLEVPGEELAGVLGVTTLRGRSEPDEVCEQNGDQPSLCLWNRYRLGLW